MTTVPVLDVTGKKVGDRELRAEIFDTKVSVPLMHQVVVAGLASLRAGTHATKNRGEVSGGGRKPWRQKGTGRARQGSIRAPQWTGGGVVHGPRSRSHELRVNKKMKRGALRSALTDALRSGKLTVIDELPFDEPKTRRAAELLEVLGAVGRVLVVLAGPTGGAVEKSFRNIPFVKVAYAASLGTYDVLAADRVLFTQAALDVLEGRSVERTAAERSPNARPEPDAEATGAKPAQAVQSDDRDEGAGA